ncbi:MAG TPA: MFS transporter [Steroidobacteraceae bacterium]|nr:MFS transporter [Steroidobacteraceae bacterium]
MNAPRWWQGLTREQWLVFAGASLAWAFDCFDLQVFNLARDAAMEDLIADPALALEYGPYTTSVFLVAWAVGGLIFGALGDRYGRARMLTICILLYSVSTGLSSFSTGFLDFCVYRFATGLGVGGVFGLAVALVADSLPDRSRAPALGLLQSLSTWGNLAAALIGMLFGSLAARQLLPWGLAHWQAMFLVGALPALLCVPLMRQLKEPPKWVTARREGSARGIQFGSYRRLLTHPVWSKRAWLGLIVCSAGIIGLWGVGNFHPKIVGTIVEQHFINAGLSPGDLASEKAYWRSIGLLLQNVGGFFGMLALAQIAQAYGRRIAIGLALLLSIASTWIVFRYMREFEDMYWMLPLMGFGQLSVLGAYAVYLPELFPTSLRSTGTSFCYNVGRIVAATAPFTLSQLTRSLGGDIEGFRTAGTWVSLVLLIGIAVLPWMPETKDRPLPED